MPHSNTTSSSTATTIGTSSGVVAANPFLVASTISRSIEIITLPTAQCFTNMHSSSSTDTVRALGIQGSFVTRADYSVWQNLQHICNRNYRVKPTLYDNDTTTTGSSTGSGSTTSKRVVFVGQAEDLAVVQTLLRQAENASISSVSSVAKLHLLSLRNQQSRILTQDWRFIPEYISTIQSNTTTTSSLDDDSFIPYYARKLQNMPVLSGYLPIQSLPVSARAHYAMMDANNTAENSSNTTALPESQLRSLLLHIHTLCTKLNYTIQASLHAQSLLVRYIRYLPTMLTKDTMAVLAAVLSITAKCSSNFKYKLLVTIVHTTYCQVYSRDSSIVSIDSIEPYISICIEKENHIYSQLKYDIYTSTVFPTLYSALRASMNTEKWYLENETALSGMNVEHSDQKNKRRDREAERIKLKQIATYQYESNIRTTVRRAVLYSSELLASELFYLRTNSTTTTTTGCTGNSSSTNVSSIRDISTTSDGMLSLYTLPVEVVQLGCVTLVCILYKLLPSGSTHKRIYKELTSYLSEVVTTALSTLSLTPAVLQWVTEVVAAATWTSLTELGHIEPLRELAEVVSSGDQEVLLRGDLPAALTAALAELTTPPPLPSTSAVGTGVVSTVSNNIMSYGNSNSTTTKIAHSNSNNNAICKMRFPWLPQDHSTSSGSCTSSSTTAVYLEAGVCFEDLQSERRQLLKHTEKELPIIATAKVSCSNSSDGGNSSSIILLLYMYYTEYCIIVYIYIYVVMCVITILYRTYISD